MEPSVESAFRLLNDIFPDKAKNLLDAIVLLNQNDEQMDDWRERQVRHFLEITISSVADLKRAYEERRVSTLAWLTRNLLELLVWIQYCNLNDENAKRFYDDAVRDMHGWAKAVHELTIFQDGRPDAKLASRLDNLDKFAAKRGIAPLADDFKRVSDASKEVGNDVLFSKSNKLYSKFAHPTAWVVATAKSEEADKEVRGMIFKDGEELAVMCYLVIRDEMARLYPDIVGLGQK
jgi:hypothetical protein